MAVKKRLQLITLCGMFFLVIDLEFIQVDELPFGRRKICSLRAVDRIEIRCPVMQA
ncbi:hypothetical protein [Chelativorans alearense]|uniref:hypothetical protein n=1 Tax=Chelativorans alearense TaxID=2681495 RepID=UPI001FE57CC7|nr:hypothetical protein [Chelativorans alearense]